MPPRVRAVRAIPNPPAWLDREAKAEWRRITPELHRLGILSNLDRAQLAIRCDVWSRWNKARLLTKTLTVKARRAGEERKHPAWQVYRDTAELLIKLDKEFGLVPNARLRMSAPELDADDDQDLT